jgi:hypothetical protein
LKSTILIAAHGTTGIWHRVHKPLQNDDQVSSPEVTIDYISVWDGLCGKIHNCNSACSTPQSSKHLAGVVVVQKLKFTSFISAGVFWFVVNLENCFADVMYAKYVHRLL